MSWRKWSDLFDFDRRGEDRPELPEISEAEAAAYCEAITRAEPSTDAEPRKAPWKRCIDEPWEDWLRRSASQQPRREIDEE